MGSAVLFSFGFRLILYSARSAVNRVQVILFEFILRLLCFVFLGLFHVGNWNSWPLRLQLLCRYGCMYLLAALMLVCVDVMVMSSA